MQTDLVEVRRDMHGHAAIFTELALVFTVAVALALPMTRLKLPPILAYLAAGAVLGPGILGWVGEADAVALLAETGVALLLFTVGLEFSFSRLRSTWRPMLRAGGAQVGLATAAGFLVALASGVGWRAAMAWGFLLALSSTAIGLRVLSDRGELNAAHGQVTLGVLIFQDLAVVPMMLLIQAAADPRAGLGTFAGTLLKAGVVVGGVMLLARWLVPPLMLRVARTANREVFLLAVLAVAGGVASATAAAGLSLALGAFLGGVALAGTAYAHQALADVLPLRSTMAALFFVSVGMLFDPDVLLKAPFQAAFLLIFVLAVKAAAGAVGGRAAGLSKPLSGLVGLALSQVGEFSFVLGLVAAEVGLITEGQLTRFTAVSVLSMLASPLAMSLLPRLPARWAAWAGVDRVVDLAPGSGPAPAAPVIVAGFGVGGRAVVEALEAAGAQVVILERNPDTVREQRARGRTAVYGDSTTPELLEEAGIGAARALVVTISDLAAAHGTARLARHLRPELPIVLRTRWVEDAEADGHAEGVRIVCEEAVGAEAVAAAAVQALRPA